METIQNNKRFISEIETELKEVLNGSRNQEQTQKFKSLLNELKGYMEYVTTEYLKNFIQDKQNAKFCLRDFMSKSNLKTKRVLGQLKQEWKFIKYTHDIQLYNMDKKGKCSKGDIKEIKVSKSYITYTQDTYHKIVERNPIATEPRAEVLNVIA